MMPPIFSGYDLKVVDSIDKLNYYSALRVLDRSAKMLDSDGEISFSLLTTYGSNEEYPDSDDSVQPDGSGTAEGIPGGTVDAETGEYYYALSADDKFVFNKISMFKIELTDENGFLASKLGLGTVDVVISEECIWGDSLITFRNGDRFFSCLSNGSGFDSYLGKYVLEFSTHKFISGFYIVKNIVQENYTFTVELDLEGQAFSVTVDEFKAGGPRADRDVRVVSETAFSSDGGSFSARELDEYFKSESPSDEENGTAA
jgi:hypothetical protein